MKELSSYIIFEDDNLMVINKPTNIHSSSIPSSKEESIVTHLRKNFPDLDSVNDECGLLQRLDFETTGCLMVAKNPTAFKYYKNLIKKKHIEKQYLILVKGRFFDKKTTEGYIGSRYRRSKKVSVVENSKDRFLFAKTSFSLEKYIEDKNISIVKARTSTGRRHQIRAKAANLDFSLIGDVLYGSKNKLEEFFPEERNLPKFVLHASSLSFIDLNRESIEIKASLPSYLLI